MAGDVRRSGAGIASLVLMIVALSGCGGGDEAVAARTDVFVITHEELENWTPFLERKRELRDRLRKAEDRRRELLEIVALIRLVPPEYGAKVPVGEIEAADRDLESRQVRSTYVDAVLRPQIEVREDEIRQIYSEHYQNYQKPEAVRVLEIFKWAPPDLPELRKERLAELETLRPRIESRDDFEAAALDHSDATSAYKGGRIGILFCGQVGGALEGALFSGGDGLTDVVASDSGLYLFFVVDRLPARSNDLSDVADGIEKTLRRRRLEWLMVEDSARLKDKYGLRIVPAHETDDGQPRLRLGIEVLTTEQLGVPAGLSDQAKIRRMEQRGLTAIMERELAQRGVVPNPPDPMELAWIRYRLAWRRAVAAQLHQMPPGDEGAGRGPGRATKIERWTFDLLRIPAGDSDGAWRAAFRACHETSPEGGLEELRFRLKDGHGLEARLQRFNDITNRDAATLGPEIHTTIKKILEPGEFSVPLFLEDRDEVVVIHLHDKRVDFEESRTVAKKRSRAEDRRAVERRLERDLLRESGFVVEPRT